MLFRSAYGTYFFSTQPFGKITLPLNHASTSHIVELEGFTKNIPIDSKLWIVVDVPSLDLCWPKRSIHKLNDKYKTTIRESGPNKEFIVSLYAVPAIIDDEIRDWFKLEVGSGNHAGFPMIPPDYRLDSITLNLK